MTPVVVDTDVVSFLFKNDARADVMVAARASGRRIEGTDAWIAATALLYDAPLVTHNPTDYSGVPNLIVLSHRP